MKDEIAEVASSETENGTKVLIMLGEQVCEGLIYKDPVPKPSTIVAWVAKTYGEGITVSIKRIHVESDADVKFAEYMLAQSDAV